jgi:biopolymer transport protein ExbD
MLGTLRHGSEHKIYLKVDVRVRYGVVKNVINSIQTTGIQNVAFFADQRR